MRVNILCIHKYQHLLFFLHHLSISLNDGGKRVDIASYVCKECLPAYEQCNKNKTQYIAKMSQDNDMDPYCLLCARAMAEYKQLITHHELTEIECGRQKDVKC